MQLNIPDEMVQNELANNITFIVLKEIENLYNLASAKKNTFYEYSQRTDNSLIAAVYKYYDSICTIFAFSDSDKSDTELSADVKSAYIASCIAYSDFLGSLQ